MKKLLPILIFSITTWTSISYSQSPVFTIPPSALFLPGQASSNSATLQGVTGIANTDGYVFDQTDTTSIRWTYGKSSISTTNCVFTFTQAATNINAWSYSISQCLYTTNGLYTNISKTIGYTGALPTAMTNIVQFSWTNSFNDPNFFNTNFLYGTLTLTHVSAANVGRVWITGGKLVCKQ